jgi:hypothetical protein
MEEALKKDYRPAAPGPAAAPPAQGVRLASVPAGAGLGPDDPCADCLSGESLSILRLYYDANVDTLKWRDCRGYTPRAMDEVKRPQAEAFRRWVMIVNLSRLRAQDLSRWHNIAEGLQALDLELRKLDVTMFFGRKGTP